MKDVASEMMERLRAEFEAGLMRDQVAEELLERIQDGKGSYADASRFAGRVGECLANALGKVLTADALPEGKMYWNIAKSVLEPMLRQDYQIVSSVAEKVQQDLNSKAGLGIKAQVAEYNTDRAKGILELACKAESYDSVAGQVQTAVVTYSQSVVDETVEKNVNAQGKLGLTPKVVRKSSWHCCEWCSALAGSYRYPDVPKDVYRRHENCNCTVEYDPGSGKTQNVWTKAWTSSENSDILEDRKTAGLTESEQFSVADYSSKLSEYVALNAAATYEKAQSGERHSGILREAREKTKNQLQKSIKHHSKQVELHAGKISNPMKGDTGWIGKTIVQKNGLLHKWEKDMLRNAEQAMIEIAVYKERFL